eukprot:NODE_252_length_11723_cov_1.965933.p11 type:complete len:111 gc:universal NODE_252_length_11723_cov_1.965933:11150-11482(+)
MSNLEIQRKENYYNKKIDSAQPLHCTNTEEHKKTWIQKCFISKLLSIFKDEESEEVKLELTDFDLNRTCFCMECATCRSLLNRNLESEIDPLETSLEFLTVFEGAKTSVQ